MSKKLNLEDLLEFERLTEDLKKIKADELALRNKIIKAFRYKKTEGIEHKSIEGAEIDIGVTLKMNRKIDSDGLDMIWSDLTDEQRDAVEYVPKLKESVYKKLVKEDLAGELMNVVIETPGQASVELKFD